MNRSLHIVSVLLADVIFFSCQKELAEPSMSVVSDKKWFVSTFAGSGDVGTLDGDSTTAQFNTPTGLAVDSHNNLFVSDLFSFNIRKISPEGKVTTYAGRSIYNPPGLEFGYSYDIAVDRSDHLYSVDNGIIRKIESPTVSSDFAGRYLWSNYEDGTGTAALFNVIAHLAIDAQNNIYVPDYDLDFNFRIRKISPTGVVSTLSIVDNTSFPSRGSQSGAYLVPIAVDDIGNIYIAADSNTLIKKITPQGVASVFAGAGGFGFIDGKADSAKFNVITGLAIDPSGNLWAADPNNNAIRRITPDGTVTTIAGGTQGYADGEGAQAQFFGPYEIAVDKKGIVYVSDMGNNRIRKIEYK